MDVCLRTGRGSQGCPPGWCGSAGLWQVQCCSCVVPTALVWPRCPVPVPLPAPLPRLLPQHDSSRSAILALCTNLPVVAEGPVLGPLQQQLLLPLLSLTLFGLWHNGGLQRSGKIRLNSQTHSLVWGSWRATSGRQEQCPWAGLSASLGALQRRPTLLGHAQDDSMPPGEQGC